MSDVTSNRLTPEERFLRDPQFSALVSTLEAMIHRADYTPTELREAVMLAAIRYESRQSRHPFVFDSGSKP